MYMKGGSKRGGRAKNKTKMPLCSYGTACTRSDCVYRHPPKSATQAKSATVCVKFLTDECTYGSNCRNHHPNSIEKPAIIARYGTMPCTFAEDCLTTNCLFMHPIVPTPQPQPEHIYMEPTALSSRMTQQHQQEYKEHVQYSEFNQHDTAQNSAYSGLYFADGGQRGVNNESNCHDSIGQQYQQQEAQPHTTSQNTGLNLAEGSKSEVNNGGTGVLFSELSLSAGAREFVPSFGQSADLGSITHDISQLFPTETPSTTALFNNACIPSSLPQPPPQQQLTMADRIGAAASQLQNTSTQSPHIVSKTSSNNFQNQPKKTVRIPQEIWVSDFKRNPSHFTIADPLERFRHVNQDLHRGVIDLHFQTATSAIVVLENVFAGGTVLEVYDEDEGSENGCGTVWVVTGTGHHTQQRLWKLSDVVEEWLEANGFVVFQGKDSNGGKGAFLVKCPKRA